MRRDTQPGRSSLPAAAVLVLCAMGAGGGTVAAKMEGDELKSLQKSSAVFKSMDGVDEGGLKLPPADLDWWKDAKFGMFIHWGLYAIPARGEWVMHNEHIPAEEYAKLADQFNPRHFDASAWAQAARAAGMRYMVMVARHHDGFALWDSAASYKGFDSMRSAAKRDFVAEYVKGCRAAGLRVGLYYSPLDWRFPGYFKPKELVDNAALLKKQCYGQVEELMSRYGPIDILWYDGGWLAHSGTDADAAWFWEPVKLNTMVRKYQPKAVISPRSGWVGDFQCDEGAHEIKGPIIATPWEKCLNLNDAGWGFNRRQNMLSAEYLVKTVVNVVGRGGNVLLNVGPDADGVIPPAHVARLKEVGDWMAAHAEAIYGTRPGPLEPVDGQYVSTHRANRVYVHLLSWPKDGMVSLPPLATRILRAVPLGPGKASFTQDAKGVRLELSADAREPLVGVVALETEPAAGAEDGR